MGWRLAIPTAAVMLGALLGAAPGAVADPLTRRAGEWELTMNNGIMPQSTQRVCYAVDKPLSAIPTNRMQNCARNDVTINGDVVTVDATCPIPDKRSITVHATITPIGADSFHSESRMHMDNAPQGAPSDMTMVIDAKRIGDSCKAGETPLQ
jgi:hypothetical protein